ncbi:MAG: DUF3221 domain-containing protein [Tissierellia bacterium]|nr:DUF3221 domain-containing protein [Tissierellia bacterium]
MNKKLIFLVMVIIIGAIIFTVVNQLNNDENIETVSFNAIVIENNETSILVNPEEGSSELNSSDKIVVRVPVDNATLKDLSEFTEGAKVKITYNGMIMESYPAQINAYDVEKIGGVQKID